MSQYSNIAQIYKLYISHNPPTTSGEFQDAYQDGLVGNSAPEKNTLVYGAWKAGNDKRRALGPNRTDEALAFELGDRGAEVATVDRTVAADTVATVLAAQSPEPKIHIREMIDITAPQDVEVQIRGDGRVVWVNVDGICRFRACQIGHVTVNDERSE
jgi:hypothetical protein